MTTLKASLFIGKTAYYDDGSGVVVEVVVLDVKERWGRTRYEIRPVAGWGRKWVESLNVPDEKEAT